MSTYRKCNSCTLGHHLCVTAVHVEDIIYHMFQYIQKLRTEGPQEWVFEECKVIKDRRAGQT